MAKKRCFCYARYIKRLICSDVILTLRKVQGTAYDKKKISNIYVDINTGDDRCIDDSCDREESSGSSTNPQEGVTEYKYSAESDPQKGVALKVEWNEPKLGEDTTFHVSADGGSGRYLFRMDAPSYSNPGEYSFESVADPSRGAWIQYTDECESHDFEFTMTASGVYNFRFYVMDKTSGVYYMRVSTNIQVSDKAYPSVGDILNAVVKKCSKETDGSDYEKALWLHDWLNAKLEYDKTLAWCSAEGALTRGLGTCESYQRAYAKLLTAAGIPNERIEDRADNHTCEVRRRVVSGRLHVG